MSTDLIVDANSLYARSWFAATRISPDPKAALRLAINTVLLLLNPNTDKIGRFIDRTLFAWDGQQNKDKKREEKPAEYHETKRKLKETLSFLLGAVHVEKPDAEGDDIVATAVYNTKPEDTAFIVSGDKDLMQLHGGNCHYYSLHEKAVLSTAFITHKFHVKRPNQIALVLAITGDPVDNIPGVGGYGKAKCKKLFEKVSRDMNFSAALTVIEKQLPANRVSELYLSLNRTLLKTDIADVPAPAPLVLRDPDEITDLGIPQIDHYYRQIHHVYTVEAY